MFRETAVDRVEKGKPPISGTGPFPGKRPGLPELRTIDDDPALGELNVLSVVAPFVFLDSCSLPPPATNDGIISTLEPDLVTHQSPNADLSPFDTAPIYPDGRSA